MGCLDIVTKGDTTPRRKGDIVGKPRRLPQHKYSTTGDHVGSLTKYYLLLGAYQSIAQLPCWLCSREGRGHAIPQRRAPCLSSPDGLPKRAPIYTARHYCRRARYSEWHKWFPGRNCSAGWGTSSSGTRARWASAARFMNGLSNITVRHDILDAVGIAAPLPRSPAGGRLSAQPIGALEMTNLLPRLLREFDFALWFVLPKT